jgi:hypothetical protein
MNLKGKSAPGSRSERSTGYRDSSQLTSGLTSPYCKLIFLELMDTDAKAPDCANLLQAFNPNLLRGYNSNAKTHFT